VLGRHYIKREKDENDEEYQQRLEKNKLELDKQFEGIEQNCGLIKPGNGKYDFWHLTIQEFLAARYIATMKFDYGKEIKDYWENDWYKEVVRLLIGFLSLKNQGWANKIVMDQLENEDFSLFKRWQLASLSLWDIHEDNRNEDVVNKARHRLVTILESDVDFRKKTEAGETLGWLGDSRELREFIPVEGGKYYLRSLKKKVDITPFKMSKYPVTNDWFEEFVNDNGYTGKEYWSKDGLKWLEEDTKQPEFWNERKRRCPNSPVVGVSWFEADAFANWLTVQRGDGCYRLANENEWEAAAGGKKGRIYAWGDEWDKNKCNNRETGINRTSPVGIFKIGDIPEGISDLSGNVLEWCMDLDEGKDGSGRVLRGGGWFNSVRHCRSAYRFSFRPAYRGGSIGFRLVFVP